jgi:polyisoprenoid-binding protein YceI
LIDSKGSVIEWSGSKKITGSAHNGTIGLKEGEVQLDGKKLVGGKVVVDMASIVNLDITKKEDNAKLVGHLKSDDFFDVAKHPTSTITIKSSTQNKDGSYQVKGDLTLKGETHPVEFKATPSADGKMATADLEIDRTVWNVRYGSGKFFKNLGDKVIADKIKLSVKLQFASAIFASK